MTHTVHFTPEALDQLDKLKADPSRALSVGEVRQHLAEKRKRPASA